MYSHHKRHVVACSGLTSVCISRMNASCFRAAASPLIATFLRDVVRAMKDVRYHVKIYIKKVRTTLCARVSLHSLGPGYV